MYIDQETRIHHPSLAVALSSSLETVIGLFTLSRPSAGLELTSEVTACLLNKNNVFENYHQDRPCRRQISDFERRRRGFDRNKDFCDSHQSAIRETYNQGAVDG
jgi:hypothetical protein